MLIGGQKGGGVKVMRNASLQANLHIFLINVKVASPLVIILLFF
jgi:hypothetical protein